jgi:hypothetical protein
MGKLHVQSGEWGQVDQELGEELERHGSQVIAGVKVAVWGEQQQQWRGLL